MNRKSEVPAPPAARVVSVAALRLLDSTVDLDDFSNETLAEVQFLASRVTDDGAQVLVSIVVESDTHQATGQAEVPLEWFGEQIRMRHLINTPNDASVLLEKAEPHPGRAGTPRDVVARQLATIGLDLRARWKRRGRATKSLRLATVSWIGLVERHNCDVLHHAVDEIRQTAVAKRRLSRAERRSIGGFCQWTGQALIASTMEEQEKDYP